MKHEIIYSRFKLPKKVPKDAILGMSSDLDKIYYKNNDDDNKKIITNTNIDKSLLKNFNNMINLKLSRIGSDWLYIILQIDSDVFDDKSMLRDRKLFVSMLQQCYNERVYSYISHLSLNLVENSIKGCEQMDDVPWMISREFGSLKKIYHYPNNTIKIGNILMNLNNGSYNNNNLNNESNINLNGGIIIDKSNLHWINRMKKLIDHTNDNIQKNKSTLIVCSKASIKNWLEIFNDTSILTISDKRQHRNITYDNILCSKVVIISLEYLSSKSYSELLDDFKIGNNINDTIKIMKAEYSKHDIGNIKLPILSLIKWKRLVIDSYTATTLLKNESTLSIINTIDSVSRWIQLSGFPFIRDELIKIMDILNQSPLSYPLYSKDGEIYHINNILRSINGSNVTHNNICKIDMINVNINLNKYEIQLDHLSDEEMNNVIYNFKAKSEIKKIVPKFDPNSSSECTICLNIISDDATSVTKCGHKYCFSCIIESMRHASTCPLCREPLCYTTIYTISRVSTMSSMISKLGSMIKKNGNREKNIVYINNLKEGEYLSSYMRTIGLTNILCNGRLNNKNKVIDNFNNNDCIQTILLQINDYQLSNNIKGINNLYFLGDQMATIENINDYCGKSYLCNDIDNLKIISLLRINGIKNTK